MESADSFEFKGSVGVLPAFRALYRTLLHVLNVRGLQNSAKVINALRLAGKILLADWADCQQLLVMLARWLPLQVGLVLDTCGLANVLSYYGSDSLFTFGLTIPRS